MKEELGGAVRHHNRPYQLKDSSPEPRAKAISHFNSHFKPIQFNL